MILKSFLLRESIKREGVLLSIQKWAVTTGRPGPAPLLGGSATDEPRGGFEHVFRLVLGNLYKINTCHILCTLHDVICDMILVP